MSINTRTSKAHAGDKRPTPKVYRVPSSSTNPITGPAKELTADEIGALLAAWFTPTGAPYVPSNKSQKKAA